MENIKNAMAYAAIFLFIFIIYFGCTFIKKFKDKNQSLPVTTWTIKNGLVAFSLVVFLSVVLISHVKKNDSWRFFFADAKIAAQLDSYDHWKYFGGNGYPVNEYGVHVSNSTYERISWALIGIKLINQNPLGYGLVERSFGYLAKIQWPESNLDQSHSGIIDLTLGIGLPGVLLILVAYLLTFMRLIKKVYIPHYSSNNLLESSLIWVLFSIALMWSSSEISQKYYLIATLFWISFGIGLLHHNDCKDK